MPRLHAALTDQKTYSRERGAKKHAPEPNTCEQFSCVYSHATLLHGAPKLSSVINNSDPCLLGRLPQAMLLT